MKETRRILVTGASGGIGSAIARRLGAAGFHLCLHYLRNAAKAETLAKEIAEMRAHGTFWGVVCNAGITADNTFAAMPGDDWDKVIATNLGSFYNVLQPLVMPLVRLRDGGRIVTIASVSGIMGNRGQTNYSAAKAGLIGATKALAVELGSRRITVNCVAPGFIKTDMVHNLPMEEIMKQIPLGRAGKPEEVAGLVEFLFSESAAYITRQVLSVNGGML